MPSKTPTLYSNTSFITRYQRGRPSFKFGHKQVFYISANQRSRSPSPTLVRLLYIVSITSPSTKEQPIFGIRTVLTPKAALFDPYHTEHDSRLSSEYHQHTDNTNLHSACKLCRIKLELLIEDLQMPLVCPVLNIVFIARSLIPISQEFNASSQLCFPPKS
jgi:hypothetical protein